MKIKGYNGRIYLGENPAVATLLAHTNEVSINLDIGVEETTDAEAGDWVENLPTLNSFNADATSWYYKATSTDSNLKRLVDAQLKQALMTFKYEVETGQSYSGKGYITNLNLSGGTGAEYVQFTCAFVGTGALAKV